MDTTPIAMETETQPNAQSATNSNRSTINTTEKGKNSEKESTNETAPNGKFLQMYKNDLHCLKCLIVKKLIFLRFLQL